MLYFWRILVEETMNIMLIQPIISMERTYPLILAQLAALLSEHQVQGVDLQFQEDPLQPADLVITTALRHNAHTLRPILDWHKKRGARTVVVGEFATSFPKEAREKTGAVAAICGDPEMAIRDMAHKTPVQEIVGYTENDIVPRAKVWLKDLPMMDRDVFPIQRYSFEMRSLHYPYTMMITSRGCIRTCGYCVRPLQHPHFDARPPQQIIDELVYLTTHHNISSVHIEDDAFCTDRNRVLEFCRLMHERSVPIIWELVNGIRPEDLDLELIAAMARGGCRKIVLSLECMRPQKVGLQTKIHVAASLVEMCKQHNIRVGAYFTVGLPESSFFDDLYSIISSLRIPLDDANWIPFSSLPGSPYEQERSAGRRAHILTLLATGVFHLRNGNLAREGVRDPQLRNNLFQKAKELLLRGGPPPQREMP